MAITKVVPAGVEPPQELCLFLDALASANPAPGGGSAAAFSGAMAAALVGMVCRVTLKRQHGVEDNDLSRVLNHADELRDELTTLVALDGEAYHRVMEAMKTKRPEAIQSALMDATQTPLRTAALCGETLTLATLIAPKARKSTLSDLRVGALTAHGALHSAVITTETNLRDIRDEKFVSDQRALIAQMIEQSEKDLQRVLEI